MRPKEDIEKAIAGAVANLDHLLTSHPRWKAELETIDPEIRPQGYANQIRALGQQQGAYEREEKRLTALVAERWVAGLDLSEIYRIEVLQDILKAASSALSKEMKERTGNEEMGEGAPGLF